MLIRTQIRCPACQGPLRPTECRCDACELTIRGTLSSNEFATLSEDDLHFLRIFVLSEGRIRDMESALGVSYPTIKSKLAALKAALVAHANNNSPTELAATETSIAANHSLQGEILQQLQSGRLTFDQALAQLQQLEKGRP